MKLVILSAITLTTIFASLPARASGALLFDKSTKSGVVVENFSGLKGVTFVRVAKNAGYYVVSPQSNAIKAMGLQHAPYADSDNASRSGVGLDSIAFRFGPDGKLDGYPMYISQMSPDVFYTSKLQGLTAGHSKLELVQELFADQAIHVEKQGSRTLAYVEVPVYNPLTSGS